MFRWSRPVASKCGEKGNAVVEFIGIMAVIIVPVLVLISVLATILSAQFALQAAVRNSVREFIRSESTSEAHVRGLAAGQQAWADRGIDEPLALDFSCTASPCLSPGSFVEVNAQATVTIPILDRQVTLSDSQSMRVDEFRRVRE